MLAAHPQSTNAITIVLLFKYLQVVQNERLDNENSSKVALRHGQQHRPPASHLTCYKRESTQEGNRTHLRPLRSLLPQNTLPSKYLHGSLLPPQR